MEYCNYHKHDHVSSIMTPDTHIKAEEYIKRAVELGHTTYFTTNHGTGGDIFEAKSLCEKYGLRCIFGIEGYIVPDPFEKDNRNYHIVIIPRTNKARKKLNLANSRANIEGYYYKPRLFIEDILDFAKDDLYITTACVAGILRDTESFEKIFSPLAEHFEDNIFLEVQSHDVEIQKEINSKCQSLLNEGFKLIAANDSHYIYPEQAAEREEYLKGKGISYAEESGFILDYPDYDTMFARFQKQGILTDEQIKDAINNTLIFMNCEDIYLDKEIKMPSIYPGYTVEEKIKELKDHINKAFVQIKKTDGIKKTELERYIQGIHDEMKIIEETASISSVDYFLFNEKNTELAVNKYGGVLTRTGRGSCGSFYINRILGMTQIDRFKAPVPLYPERFASVARLIENKALPDIDYNLVSQEPFVAASRELLGEHGCYPMIAYGTMQLGEAFRNVCRSSGLEFDEYNEVAKNIESYENDNKWKPYIERAKRFVGSIVSASPHPCAHVLDNKDLREEYGVIRIGDCLCVMVTSSEADEYKLLKNDYLVVTCYKLISETFNTIHQPILSIQELMKRIDSRVWDMYALGMTATLNQVDGDWATGLIKEYKPQNLAELSMFVACLRPFFNSNRAAFIKRKEHTTGSVHLDEILKDTHGYILFQESLMKYFEWLGVTPAESIGLIKKISKKKIHQEDFDKLTDRLRKQWIINTGSEEMFKETFEDIQSCMSYGFAAPHALAVAIDSLYGAYLKANYPLEYYTVCLNNYSCDINKTAKLTKELEYFGINLKSPKFRYSAAEYSLSYDENAIYKGIKSIKNLNSVVAEEMYSLRENEYDSFIDLIYSLKTDTSITSKQLRILIELDFFSEFGDINVLLAQYDMFLLLDEKAQGTKQYKKNKLSELKISEDVVRKYANKETPKTFCGIACRLLLKDIVGCMSVPKRSLSERVKSQIDYLGYVDIVDKSYSGYAAVIDIDTKYSPRATLYSFKNGNNVLCKISKRLYSKNKITVGDIIRITGQQQKPKMQKIEDGSFIPIDGTKELWITDYRKTKL